MATLAVHSLHYYGPTDNSGDDTLMRVELSENDGPSEGFLVSWPLSYGVPTEAEVADRIASMASGFRSDTSMLEQFRARKLPHPADHPTRRVLMLRPLTADLA